MGLLEKLGIKEKPEQPLFSFKSLSEMFKFAEGQHWEMDLKQPMGGLKTMNWDATFQNSPPDIILGVQLHYRILWHDADANKKLADVIIKKKFGYIRTGRKEQFGYFRIRTGRKGKEGEILTAFQKNGPLETHTPYKTSPDKAARNLFGAQALLACLEQYMKTFEYLEAKFNYKTPRYDETSNDIQTLRQRLRRYEGVSYMPLEQRVNSTVR